MKNLRNLVKLITLLVGCLLLACQPPPAEQSLRYSTVPASGTPLIYRFAVRPLHNPKKLSAAYQPLIDHLNAQLSGVRLELEASRDYQAFEQKYAARGPAFLLPNPWQTLQAMKTGYHVMAMAGDAQDFKGIFIVRKDSGIHQPADLKGKVVSYPSPTALAAAIMPQYFLHTQGLKVTHDLHNIYVGSHESSIMNVYLGNAAAGATGPPPWRLFQEDHPREAAELKVIWETEALINNSVMVRDDVPTAVRDQVRRLLLDLAQSPDGPAILERMATTRFHAADDADYQVVARYVQRFEEAVRPIERP